MRRKSKKIIKVDYRKTKAQNIRFGKNRKQLHGSVGLNIGAPAAQLHSLQWFFRLPIGRRIAEEKVSLHHAFTLQLAVSVSYPTRVQLSFDHEK